MTADRRRGACPTLSSPMQTGDGLLARLNPIGGAISPGDLGAIAAAAAEFGNGMLEITQRGSLQIRGLKAETAAGMNAAVAGLSVVVREGLPIDISPLAGIDPGELADPLGLAEAIGAGAEVFQARLGPKVSVVIDGGGHSMLGGVKADVRLTAIAEDRWEIALAGDAVGARVVGAYPRDLAADVAVALLGEIAALGRSGRGRDLLVDLTGLRSTLPPSVLPDITPTGGEITPSSKAALDFEASLDESKGAAELEQAAELPISPLVGEMSGRTEGGATEHLFLRPGDMLALSTTSTAVAVSPAFGAMTSDQLVGFTCRIAELGITELRLSPERLLILLCADVATALSAQSAASEAGFITNPTDPRLAIVACAGKPACGSAHYDTRGLGDSLAKTSLEPGDAAYRLHLSGCEKGCSTPSGPHVDVVGTSEGRTIVANGIALPAELRQRLQPETSMQYAS